MIDSRVAFSMPRSAIRLVPEPPPMAEMFATVRRSTSAITQVPIAKWPPCRRKAMREIGKAAAIAASAPSGTARKGFMPVKLPSATSV